MPTRLKTPDKFPESDRAELHAARRRTPDALSRVNFAAPLFVAAVGGLALVGWVFNLGALKSLVPGFVTLKPNTAVCFLLAGAALWLWGGGTAPLAPGRRRVAQVCGALVTAVGLLTLGQYLFGWDLGIDELLFRDSPPSPFTSHPGRMALNAAVCFVLVGLALMLMEVETPRGRRPAEWLALAVGFIALTVVCGYIYGAREFIGPFTFAGMALHAAACFLALSAGLLAARPARGLMARVASGSPEGVIAREFALSGTALFLTLGLLTEWAGRAGFYSPKTEDALMLAASIAVFAFLIWRALAALGRMEDARRAALAASRESDERFVKAFSASPLAVTVTSLKTGRLVEVNETFVSLSGYSREEAVGRTTLELGLWAEAEDRAKELAQVAARGQVRNAEYRFRRKDGTMLVGLLSAELIEVGGEPCALSVINDITERKRSEEALRESEERLRLATDAADMFSWEVDHAAQKLTWSENAARVIGCSPDELPGDAAGGLFFVLPADRERVGREFERALEAGRGSYVFEFRGNEPEEGERRVWTAQGTIIYGPDRRPLRTVGVTQNVTERKKAEAALRESEERFSKAFNASPHLMTVTTLDDGRYLAVNDSVLRATGYRREEMLGHTSTELGIFDHPEGRAPLVAALAETGSVRDLEMGLRGKDGSIRTALISAEVIELNGRRCLLTASKDITERKRAEEALRESREVLALAMRASRMGAWSRDVAAGRVWWSEELEAIFGLPRGGFGGTEAHFHALIHPDDRAQVGREIAAAVAERRDYVVEFRFLHADGGVRWMEGRGQAFYSEDGQPQRLYGIGLDITERKLAEERLRENEERLKLALSAAAMGVWTLDLTTDRIEWSPEVYELHGVREFVGTREGFFSLVHPDDRGRVRAAVNAAVAERTLYEAEYRTFQVGVADGEGRWVASRGRADYDADGRPLRVLGVAMDVTARKAQQAELERLLALEKQARDNAEEARAQAEEARALAEVAQSDAEEAYAAERRSREVAEAARQAAEAATRAKDEFLAVVSHELRTPLNAILGWNRLLRAQPNPALPPDAAMLRRAGEVIDRSARLQLQLIEDLLDTARIISGKLRLDVRPVELVTVIAAALDTARPAAEAKGVHLSADLDSAAGEITGDGDRLQQVVWNLLSNAVKFTPAGGSVWVRLGRAGDGARIVVSDSGKGIEPEFLPHVFDRFRQSDASSARRFGGLGLGLALVKHLVELHGGTVEAASDGEGRGATFTVQLPARSTYAAAPAAPAAPPRVDLQSLLPADGLPTLDGLRVLVADDEPDARAVTALALQEYGAEVVAASDGVDALAALQTPPGGRAFDAFVCDIAMPGEDGYDVIRRVRALPPERGGAIPAIALTAYARPEDRVRALQAGFQMHVAKPVDPGELLVVMTALLGRTGAGAKA